MHINYAPEAALGVCCEFNTVQCMCLESHSQTSLGMMPTAMINHYCTLIASYQLNTMSCKFVLHSQLLHRLHAKKIWEWRLGMRLL